MLHTASSDVTVLVPRSTSDASSATSAVAAASSPTTAASVASSEEQPLRFEAHRAVLAARSSFFAAMFSAGMQETASGRVCLRGRAISEAAPAAVPVCGRGRGCCCCSGGGRNTCSHSHTHTHTRTQALLHFLYTDKVGHITASLAPYLLSMLPFFQLSPGASLRLRAACTSILRASTTPTNFMETLRTG